MKRSAFVRHLETHGCYLAREGGNHSVYRNRTNGRQSTVPRHREIKDALVRKVCRDLEIPLP